MRATIRLVPLVAVLIYSTPAWAAATEDHAKNIQHSPAAGRQPTESKKQQKPSQDPVTTSPAKEKPVLKKIDSKKDTPTTGLCDGS